MVGGSVRGSVFRSPMVESIGAAWFVTRELEVREVCSIRIVSLKGL